MIITLHIDIIIDSIALNKDLTSFLWHMISLAFF